MGEAQNYSSTFALYVAIGCDISMRHADMSLHVVMCKTLHDALK